MGIGNGQSLSKPWVYHTIGTVFSAWQCCQARIDHINVHLRAFNWRLHGLSLQSIWSSCHSVNTPSPFNLPTPHSRAVWTICSTTWATESHFPLHVLLNKRVVSRGSWSVSSPSSRSHFSKQVGKVAWKGIFVRFKGDQYLPRQPFFTLVYRRTDRSKLTAFPASAKNPLQVTFNQTKLIEMSRTVKRFNMLGRCFSNGGQVADVSRAVCAKPREWCFFSWQMLSERRTDQTYFTNSDNLHQEKPPPQKNPTSQPRLSHCWLAILKVIGRLYRYIA